MCIRDSQYTGEGTGFSFTHFNGDEMADAVFRAAHLFWDNRDAFNGLVENAMKAVSYTHLDVYKRQGVPTPPHLFLQTTQTTKGYVQKYKETNTRN